jgi:CRISPR/Cas system CSM-associated protein Csm3 (group 7 of RAMP superfamily)
MRCHRITIRFESGLHHGSGFGLSGLVDRAVLRDGRGVPYLAASAIKGKLRHATLRVVLSEGEPACQTADGGTWCAETEVCAICTLFGSPRREGGLFFTDAYPSGETGKLLEELEQLPRVAGLHRDSMVRARSSIDRKLGTARARLLYSTEVLPEFLVFEGRICGVIQSHLELLRKASRVITHFGADGARGLGRCALEIGDEVLAPE